MIDMVTDHPHILHHIERSGDQAPDASIIWLHGLGADGHDFEPVVAAMQPLPHIRFILPHAPEMPVTINNGYVMPAWYDILGMDLTARQDEAGINLSSRAIEALIASEIDRGIAPNRIALAGFSQGGAIALHCGLRYPQTLAGIIALSTYLPLKWKLDEERHPANRNTPIFMAHGAYDDIIPMATAQSSKHLMEESGYAIDWHEYAMPHAVCNEEIADIREFILRILKPR